MHGFVAVVWRYFLCLSLLEQKNTLFSKKLVSTKTTIKRKGTLNFCDRQKSKEIQNQNAESEDIKPNVCLGQEKKIYVFGS